MVYFTLDPGASWLEPDGHGALFMVAAAMANLNGASNVGIYAFWMRRAAASDERVVVGAVMTAFDEPRTVLNDFEQNRIDGYFDLVSPPTLETRSCNSLDSST